MFATANAPGSGVHPINIMERDSDRKHDGSGYALLLTVIFVVFIIFAIIIFFAFFARKDERRHEGLNAGEATLPLMTAAIMQSIPRRAECGCGCGGKGHGDDYKMWDHALNDCKEFGNVKTEIKTVGWELSKESYVRQAETNAKIEQVKADVLASERRILDRIAQSELDQIKSERDAARLEASNLRYHWMPPAATCAWCPPDPAFAA